MVLSRPLHDFGWAIRPTATFRFSLSFYFVGKTSPMESERLVLSNFNSPRAYCTVDRIYRVTVVIFFRVRLATPIEKKENLRYDVAQGC